MRRSFLILLLLILNPLSAQAWWNEGWEYRKQLTLDTSVTGADLAGDLQNVPVLVRLHTGNFGYFLDIKPGGEDIRFVAGDDQTPLKHHVERFDAINEMALVWVLLPEIKAGSKSTSIWMYYGNPTAVAGDDANGSYSPQHTLVYHFDSEQTAPRDATAYNNAVARFEAELNAASLIGDGVSFNGAGSFVIADAPALVTDPAAGWTWSAWLNLDAEQNDAVVFERSGENGSLVLGIDGVSVYARLLDASGNPIETPRNGKLAPGSWHHVALGIDAGRMALYIDGDEVAYVEAALPVLQGDITVGSAAAGDRGFIGKLDEINIYNVSRDAPWFQAAIASQGTAASLLVYGEDAAKESGGEPSYFAITLRNVTVDGWVVIVVLAVMAAISWVVMISKGLAISQIRKDNRAFQEKFAELGIEKIDALDHEESEDEKQLRDSSVLMALSGDHAQFASSSVFRIYHAGIKEMHTRMPNAAGAQSVGAQASHQLELSHQAIDAIRATMSGVLTRENQRLNSQMVLLTIAISGGPFLGLLGTVVGVMITFAAIAASGDVNVNAIAPGIAAALVATVAGLAVAIPALFGYNYLGSRIKEVSADMHVFVDEFVAKVAEQHS